MLETAIMLLIYLCILAIIIYVAIWVLGMLGIALPEPVVKILWVIVALVALLLIVRMLLPGFGLKLSMISEAVAAPKRTQVVVPAPPRPAHPIAYPVAAIPPLAIFYDLNRRLNCLSPPDPLFMGGPGFDAPVSPNSTVMIPACQRLHVAPR